MSIEQLFRWFCKEQKITHKMRDMYYAINPYKNIFDNGCFETIYISFDEYIHEKVNTCGFAYLFNRILEDYCNRSRGMKTYDDDYWRWRSKLFEEFNVHIKKWEYFVRHNIFLNDDRIKVGNTLKYNNWGNIRQFTITSINVREGRIYGDITNNGRLSRTLINIGQLLDDNNKALEVDFYIKRNKKTYYGKN